jgi:hypothetical protein
MPRSRHGRRVIRRTRTASGYSPGYILSRTCTQRGVKRGNVQEV